MGKRDDRFDAIRTIVRADKVRTQQELAEKLRSLSFDCTQATVSRDIAEMGLAKSDEGNYLLPEDLRLIRALSDYMTHVEDAGNIVVLKTTPGGANVVGEAIDRTVVDGLVGSIAGDDTLMIVAKNEEYAVNIVHRFQAHRR